MKTIFVNGTFFSGDGFLHSATDDTVMVIKDDRIMFIGSKHDARAREAEQGEYCFQDLQGRTVLPGFIDGHVHALLYGMSLSKLSLDDCKSLDDIRATIKTELEANPSIDRLLCRGWAHPMTDGKALASMIDDLWDKPIFIDSKDLHSVWCNTPALTELEIQDMPNPVGGEIHRDEKGNPTGLLSEAVAFLVAWPHSFKMASTEYKIKAIRAGIESYNKAGYTGMVEMAMDEFGWDALCKLKEQENLNIRLAAHWLIPPSETNAESLAQVDRAIALYQQFNLETSPDLRIAGIKVICDGVVDACTAALSEPYSSRIQGSGDPLWKSEMLKEVVHKADAAGLQCALHAIGDRAVTMALDAFASIESLGKRHRIEHLEVTSPGDVQRLHDLGITASIQPVHADPAILRAWPDLLGTERVGRAFAYREFLDAGANVAIGTDAPTAPYLPMSNLYVATTRYSARDPTVKPVNPHFALPFLQALSAASAGSAYSCFADKIAGKLEAGMKADFAIVSMETDPERLLAAEVHETWFNGRRVFGQ